MQEFQVVFWLFPSPSFTLEGLKITSISEVLDKLSLCDIANADYPALRKK